MSPKGWLADPRHPNWTCWVVTSSLCPSKYLCWDLNRITSLLMSCCPHTTRKRTFLVTMMSKHRILASSTPATRPYYQSRWGSQLHLFVMPKLIGRNKRSYVGSNLSIDSGRTCRHGDLCRECELKEQRHFHFKRRCKAPSITTIAARSCTHFRRLHCPTHRYTEHNPSGLTTVIASEVTSLTFHGFQHPQPCGLKDGHFSFRRDFRSRS